MTNERMLSILANVLQIANFEMNVTEISNDELMKHLLQQDKVLDEQTNIYLKKIIEQNDIIIDLLKKGEK